MRLSVVAAILVASAGVAAAQPGMYTDQPIAPPGMTPPAADRDEPPVRTPPPAAEPVVATTTTAPALAPIDQLAHDDAAADRAFGLSTAIVQPSGGIDVSLRAASFGGIVSVAAGLGSGIEISADVGGLEHETSAYGAGLKLQLAKRGTWAFALTGSIHTFKDSCGDCMSTDTMMSAGAVLTGCVDASCGLVANVGGGVFGASGESKLGYVTAGAIAGHGSIRAIGEAMLGVSDNGHGMLGFGGLRLGGRHVAVDVGIGVELEDNGSGGLPMAALSLRP